MKRAYEETTFERMRKRRGNGHPSNANKGRIKRLFKTDRHLGKKRHR